MSSSPKQWFAKANAALGPHPIPTTFSDGSTLVGVLYDCGYQDLLFYKDALLVTTGSSRDTYASAQPYGMDVASGKPVADLPALGPARRPEAQRLAALLRTQTRREFLATQTTQYDALSARKQQHTARPTLTPWHYFDCVLIYRPHILGAARIFLRATTNAYLDLSMENNDWLYTKELLEACLPGLWREVDKAEYQKILRSS